MKIEVLFLKKGNFYKFLEKNLYFKIMENRCKLMKLKYKVLSLVMFVMLICCVSAASATDVDNITVPDDADVIEIDDVADSVDDVEQDDVSSDNEVIQTRDIVTESNYGAYFNSSTGNMISNVDLTFSGTFNAKPFGNFKVNQPITINAGGATFNNIGFDLITSNITLNGGEFYADEDVTTNAVIYVEGSGVTVYGAVIDVVAPEDEDFIAIDVVNSAGALIDENNFTYECTHQNLNNTNYVIRVKNSPNITLSLNEIFAVLPFKNVDYNISSPRVGMDKDLVACIGINGSDGFRIDYNILQGYIVTTCEGFPTLDMIIVCDSDEGYIGYTHVNEIDYITEQDTPSYLYAVDVYRCNNLTIEENELYLESEGGTYIPGTDNGTSAAYGIQLTGGYTGVVINHNIITTKNGGPNAGIYSQNFNGTTSLSITNNTIHVEGNANLHPWSLVTGMELQDDYAYVAGNSITVYNKGGYVNGSNAYGISFSQYYVSVPTFEITNNTIELINGDYAIYTQISNPGSYATNNHLTSTHYTGDNAVYPDGVIYINGNY